MKTLRLILILSLLQIIGYGQDTIRCSITRMNVGNIYFYKRKGHRNLDYISQHRVDHYYKHLETVVFDSFKDKYFEYNKQ